MFLWPFKILYVLWVYNTCWKHWSNAWTSEYNKQYMAWVAVASVTIAHWPLRNNGCWWFITALLILPPMGIDSFILKENYCSWNNLLHYILQSLEGDVTPSCINIIKKIPWLGQSLDKFFNRLSWKVVHVEIKGK